MSPLYNNFMNIPPPAPHLRDLARLRSCNQFLSMILSGFFHFIQTRRILFAAAPASKRAADVSISGSSAALGPIHPGQNPYSSNSLFFRVRFTLYIAVSAHLSRLP